MAGVSRELVRAAYLVTRSDQAGEDVVQEALVGVGTRRPRARRMDHPEAHTRRSVLNLAIRGSGKRGRDLSELTRSSLTGQRLGVKVAWQRWRIVPS